MNFLVLYRSTQYNSHSKPALLDEKVLDIQQSVQYI
jgi:hypothetical protein